MWNETGIGRYIRNIVSELMVMDTENTYVLFLQEDTYNTLKVPSNFSKVKANMRWHTFAEQLVLPLIYYRENLDLLYVPHFNAPILYFKKFIVTIHDLTILHVKTGRATTLPYPLYFLKRLAFMLTIASSIIRSSHIFAVSNFVASEIKSTYKINPAKVSLTTNAVGESFKQIDSNSVDKVLKKYSVTRPYIFYVGNAHPHKNLERLIQAFVKISDVYPDVSLVLGGNKKFFYERIEKESQTLKNFSRINFIGFVADNDLPALYTGAEVFVNPSLYEGFGIQVLEAFACGTKVACSNTTSLPEVGGGVASYFDPRNVDNMCDVISEAIKSGPNKKVAAGQALVKSYSWNKSARTILNYIKNNEISNNL